MPETEIDIENRLWRTLGGRCPLYGRRAGEPMPSRQRLLRELRTAAVASGDLSPVMAFVPLPLLQILAPVIWAIMSRLADRFLALLHAQG